MQPRHDIHFGLATVPEDVRGGWALPGGKSTHCEEEARDAAADLDLLIRQAQAVAPAKVVIPVVVTRRAAQDTRYVHSRA